MGYQRRELGKPSPSRGPGCRSCRGVRYAAGIMLRWLGYCWMGIVVGVGVGCQSDAPGDDPCEEGPGCEAEAEVEDASSGQPDDRGSSGMMASASASSDDAGTQEPEDDAQGEDVDETTGGEVDETTGGFDSDTADGSTGGAEDTGIGMSGDFPLLARPWPDGPDPAVSAQLMLGSKKPR